MTSTARRILIVTGEASGDLHGAKLISAVKAQSPETIFYGVGGPRMEAAGCGIMIPGEQLAVMGIVEVLGHFPVIWRSFQRLKRELQSDYKPDALVLIDFPDFNLRLANQAHKSGVPVLYYVSPQVWAWRKGRVKQIARVVDALAAIFPFEPAYYEGLNITVKYVGHPLLDEFAAVAEPVDLRRDLQIPETSKIVGLFPGSRRNELRFMLETLVEAAILIRAGYPDVHFLAPVADSLSQTEIQSKFPADFPVSFIKSSTVNIYDTARCCDTILSVSGTVTLQIALACTPMAIFYKASPLTYAIGKRLIRVEHFGLPNIVAGARVVPEFLQDMATPKALSDEALHVLNDTDYAMEIRAGLRKVHDKLGEAGCSNRVAAMLFEMLNRRETTQSKEKNDE